MMKDYFQTAIYDWVVKTKLLQNYDSHDDHPDLYCFYESFKSHFKNKIEYLKLQQFLYEFYPSFELELDNNNCLNTSEYVYVYGLLLHFSTIMFQDEFFQSAANQVTTLNSQTILYNFLNLLMKKQKFDKTSLREIIEESSFKQTLCLLNDRGQLCTSTPPSCTPKATLLNKKNARIHALEAELETEKCKFQYMETQYEETLKDLHIQLSQYMEENTALQHEILRKESEMGSMNCDREVGQARNALQKQVNMKDEVIMDQILKIRILNEENDTLSKKIFSCESQFVNQMKVISDLETRNQDLEQHLESISEQNSLLEGQVDELKSFIERSNYNLKSSDLINFSLIENDFIADPNTSHVSEILDTAFPFNYSLPVYLYKPLKNRDPFKLTPSKPNIATSFADELFEIHETKLSKFFVSIKENSIHTNESGVTSMLDSVHDQNSFYDYEADDRLAVNQANPDLLMESGLGHNETFEIKKQKVKYLPINEITSSAQEKIKQLEEENSHLRKINQELLVSSSERKIRSKSFCSIL